ncbi:MAG: hypothetical protein ACETWK_01300 [Candidatus Aminicenantaceae bacterium]
MHNLVKNIHCRTSPSVSGCPTGTLDGGLGAWGVFLIEASWKQDFRILGLH